MGLTVCSLGEEKSINYQIFNRVHMKKYRKAISILTAVVLGSLLLMGLYKLIDEVVLPLLQEKIIEMFNYTI